MMFDQEAVDKLPVAFKTLIGFVLFATGAYQIAFASVWSMGDIRFYYTFVAIGVMFIVNGLPSLLDGIMTMFADKKVE